MVKAYAILFGSSIIWGMFPLYFYLTRHVSAIETVSWRVTLAALCLVAVCLWRGTLSIVFERLRYPRFLAAGLITGTLIGVNWLFYILAVYHNQTTQASMGYFVTPLINVLFGLWLFNEKLTRLQWVALGFACVGLFYQIVILGFFPWLSLGVGLSFGLYGALRKLFRVPPFAGLLLEMVILSPIALGVLIWGWASGNHFAYQSDWIATGALLVSGVLTVLPLWMFLYGVEKLSMATVGFAQYVSPSLQFLVAIFIFHEPFDSHRLITFIFIWIGVAIYLFDIFNKIRKHHV